MNIYAADIRADQKIVTRHVSPDAEIFEREVIVDFIEVLESGDVHVQGYYEDNGDDYERVLDPDDELKVA
jgi:hypothetical protein